MRVPPVPLRPPPLFDAAAIIGYAVFFDALTRPLIYIVFGTSEPQFLDHYETVAFATEARLRTDHARFALDLFGPHHPLGRLADCATCPGLRLAARAVDRGALGICFLRFGDRRGALAPRYLQWTREFVADDAMYT